MESLIGRFYNRLHGRSRAKVSWGASGKRVRKNPTLPSFHFKAPFGDLFCRAFCKFKHFPAFILRLHLVIYSAGHSANSNTSQLSFWGSIWWFILPGILQIQTLPSFHFEAPFGDLFCRSFCKFKHFPAFILRLHLVIYSAGHSANSNTSQLSFWGSIWWFILPGILQIQTLPSFHFEAPFGDLFCRAFCQKCRWQATDKHTYTLHIWLCMKWHGCMVYAEHAKMAAVSCGSSHASAVSTSLWWIFKNAL